MQCICDFFERRFGFEADSFPSFEEIVREGELDIEVEASGVHGEVPASLLLVEFDRVRTYRERAAVCVEGVRLTLSICCV